MNKVNGRKHIALEWDNNLYQAKKFHTTGTKDTRRIFHTLRFVTIFGPNFEVLSFKDVDSKVMRKKFSISLLWLKVKV